MTAVFVVEMERILVHGQKREPGVVRFGDTAPGPVLVNVADREILQIAPEGFPVSPGPHCLGFDDHG
jgi:methyl coenzyme M reductase subunit D